MRKKKAPKKRKRGQTLLERVVALERDRELLWNQLNQRYDIWIGELKKAIAEMYKTRQGMTDILPDILELRAKKSDGAAVWMPDEPLRKR